jgi:hypothetical protein
MLKGHIKIPENLDVIFSVSRTTHCTHDVDKHLQSGLKEALKEGRKRRQRGKRLNLVGEKDSGE